MSEEITTRIKNIVSPQVINHEENPVNPILKSFFRLDEVSDKDNERLQEINDYLGDMPDMERITVLKDIRYKLGAPRIGTSELDHFHKWIRIKNSIKSKEVELMSLEQ